MEDSEDAARKDGRIPGDAQETNNSSAVYEPYRAEAAGGPHYSATAEGMPMEGSEEAGTRDPQQLADDVEARGAALGAAVNDGADGAGGGAVVSSTDSIGVAGAAPVTDGGVLDDDGAGAETYAAPSNGGSAGDDPDASVPAGSSDRDYVAGEETDAPGVSEEAAAGSYPTRGDSAVATDAAAEDPGSGAARAGADADDAAAAAADDDDDSGAGAGGDGRDSWADGAAADSSGPLDGADGAADGGPGTSADGAGAAESADADAAAQGSGAGDYVGNAGAEAADEVAAAGCSGGDVDGAAAAAEAEAGAEVAPEGSGAGGDEAGAAVRVRGAGSTTGGAAKASEDTVATLGGSDADRDGAGGEEAAAAAQPPLSPTVGTPDGSLHIGYGEEGVYRYIPPSEVAQTARPEPAPQREPQQQPERSESSSSRRPRSAADGVVVEEAVPGGGDEGGEVGGSAAGSPEDREGAGADDGAADVSGGEGYGAQEDGGEATAASGEVDEADGGDAADAGHELPAASSEADREPGGEATAAADRAAVRASEGSVGDEDSAPGGGAEEEGSSGDGTREAPVATAAVAATAAATSRPGSARRASPSLGAPPATGAADQELDEPPTARGARRSSYLSPTYDEYDRAASASSSDSRAARPGAVAAGSALSAASSLSRQASANAGVSRQASASAGAAAARPESTASQRRTGSIAGGSAAGDSPATSRPASSEPPRGANSTQNSFTSASGLAQGEGAGDAEEAVHGDEAVSAVSRRASAAASASQTDAPGSLYGSSETPIPSYRPGSEPRRPMSQGPPSVGSASPLPPLPSSASSPGLGPGERSRPRSAMSAPAGDSAKPPAGATGPPPRPPRTHLFPTHVQPKGPMDECTTQAASQHVRTVWSTSNICGIRSLPNALSPDFRDRLYEELVQAAHRERATTDTKPASLSYGLEGGPLAMPLSVGQKQVARIHPLSGMFTQYEYLPSEYDRMKLTGKFDRLKHKLALTAPTEFIVRAPPVALRGAPAFSEFTYANDPSDAYPSSMHADADLGRSKVVAGPFYPSGRVQPAKVLKGRLDECMMRLCKQLSEDWPESFLQVFEDRNGSVVASFDKGRAVHEGDLSNYMNTLAKRNHVVATYQLLKDATRWGLVDDDTQAVFYVMWPPWVRHRYLGPHTAAAFTEAPNGRPGTRGSSSSDEEDAVATAEDGPAGHGFGTGMGADVADGSTLGYGIQGGDPCGRTVSQLRTGAY